MAELRNARATTKLTQRQVAEALDWSPSKLLRIENGNVSISKTDLEALLRHYGVKDRRRIEELTKLAQAAKKQPQNRYQGVVSAELAKFYDLRSAAIRIRQFELIFIPALLQTEEYAAEILRNAVTPPSEEVLQRRVAIRSEQHDELFDREDPPEMYFVIDEAALRRQVGGSRVMRHQLEELRRLGAHPKVSIQILPFSDGAHRGMPGPFQIIEFEPIEDYLLYLENSRGDMVTQEANDETTRYVELFWGLEEQATAKVQLNEFLDQVIRDMTPSTRNSEPAAAPVSP
jgi:transcriptional regulator with XRE-family HTH domain